MIPRLKFTAEESQRAHREWGDNCGPHALAAAMECSLDEVRPHFVGFELKRYTNPSMMENAINLMFKDWERQRGLKTKEIPVWGVARVQWEGRWLNPGVPKVVAYRHTQWIACGHGNVFCTVMPTFGWHPYAEWSDYITRWACGEAYTGWHITHHYTINLPF